MTAQLLFMLTLMSNAIGNDWKPVNTISMENVTSQSRYSKLTTACRYGRYLESENDVTLLKDMPHFQLPPGWEMVRSDPRLKLYQYTAYDKLTEKDRDGNFKDDLSSPRPGVVITFSPSPERVAAWIANAVLEIQKNREGGIGRKTPEALEIEFAKYIKGQSHSQFPVVGMVWEDLVEKGGKNECFRFLDGVTIKTTSLPLKGYYKTGYSPSGSSSWERYLDRLTTTFDEKSREFSLQSFWGEGGIRAAKYARIASTERHMVDALYKKMAPRSVPPRTCGNHFANYIREQHITAMNGFRNELLVATLLYRTDTGSWKKEEAKTDCD